MQFFIPLEKVPTHTAQQGSRTTKTGRHYKDTELENIKAMYRAALAPHKPDSPLPKGPISLTTKWLHPADKKHPAGTWKITKPDTDNLVKAFKDSLTDMGFWGDDSWVADEHTCKVYWEVTGIFVLIKKMDWLAE
jgi:Holliday junction resolvase RusA-like endonuclease